MSPEVFRITYKYKAWAISSDRYYSAENLLAAVESFVHCIERKRMDGSRLKITAVKRFNRFSGRWENCLAEAAEHILHLPTEHESVRFYVDKDKTISIKLK